jgi:hypothetical protein
MLSSIHPLGERARGNRWAVTTTAYVIGSTAGGVISGALVAMVGRAVGALAGSGGRWPLVLAAAACVLGAVLEIRALVELPIPPVPLPTVRRQVNEDWLSQYRGWVYGVGFGFQLGLGVVTIVTTWAIYVAGVAALSLGWSATTLRGAEVSGFLVGATFGLARSLPLLARARTTEPAGLRASHRRLVAHDRLSQAFTVTVMAIAGGVLATVAAI